MAEGGITPESTTRTIEATGSVPVESIGSTPTADGQHPTVVDQRTQSQILADLAAQGKTTNEIMIDPEMNRAAERESRIGFGSHLKLAMSDIADMAFLYPVLAIRNRLHLGGRSPVNNPTASEEISQRGHARMREATTKANRT